MQRQSSLEFAAAWAFVLLVVAGIWNEASWTTSLPYLAAALLGLGLLAPPVLWPLARTWERLATWLGRLTNRLLLGGVFFGVLTPLALLRRALRRKPQPSDSYWQEGVPPYDADSLKNPF